MKVKKEQLNNSLKTLLFAMIIMHEMICGFFQHVLGRTSNANLYVLLCWFFIFVISIICGATYNLSISSALLVMLNFVYYIISKYIVGGCVLNFIQIIFFSIIPILVATQKVNSRKVLEHIMCLSLVSILFLDVLFTYQYEGYQQASMGNSYSVMVPVIASLIHFRYYRYTASNKIRLLYCYNLFLLIKLINTANRGVILSLIVCLGILLINKFETNGEKRTENDLKKIFRVIIIFIFYLIFSKYLEVVLLFLNNLRLSKFDNIPSFIIKTISLAENNRGDISNGRTKLYEIVFTLIKKSPLLGYGIGTFSTYTSYPWAHNYLLQFMFEGGIILSIIPLYVTIKMFIFVLLPYIKNKNEFSMILLMFCLCVPRYLISNDPWRGTAVWMMISYGCANSFFMKKKNLYYKRKDEIVCEYKKNNKKNLIS